MSSGTVSIVAPRRNSPSRAISLGLAVLLAGVLLYYSLRGIEWRQVWSLICEARPAWLALGCGLSAAALFLRAMRWRILLRAQGDIGVGAALWATSAGYFGNNFLPARAGELVRTFMISSRTGLSKAFVLTTALSERVADAIALVIIGALALAVLPAQPGWLANASKLFAVLGVVAVVAMAVFPRLEPLGRTILERLPMPHALRAKLMAVLEQSVRGFQALHEPPRLLGFVGLTIVIWCVDATGMVIAAKALGLTMALPVAFLLLAGMGLGSALPSTPGYVGIYQFVAVSLLTPFGFTRSDAIAYILLAQALSYVMIGCWGAVGFWQYRRVAPQASSPRPA